MSFVLGHQGNKSEEASNKALVSTWHSKPSSIDAKNEFISGSFDSINLSQQLIDNRAVQQILYTNQGDRKRGSNSDLSCFGHDFSRISIHASAPRAVQSTPSDSIAGDRYPHETDGITYGTTGKPPVPLPDEPPWIEMSGNGGPGSKPSGTVPLGGGASAATPPKLNKKTVSGPTDSDCGGFNWAIQWVLDKKTTKGGWVVQKVELPYNVTACDNKAVDPSKVSGLKPSWYPLWEAWQINKDQQVTTYAEGGDVYDDTYASSGPGSDTKGSVMVRGTAEFYDGLTLPSSFKVTNKPPTGILPATNSAPTLSGGTGTLSHNLKATWNCCSKDKTATKTKIETV